MGNRARIGSSMGADIVHEFDVWGNTIGRQSKGWQSQIKRDKFGLEKETLLPGGISSHWKRDQRGRISAHWVNKANNQAPAPLRNHQYLPDLLRSVKYEWDVEDRLKSLTDPLGGMMQFEHDSFGNLTKTTFGDGKAQLRNPDPVGNLFETKDRTDRRYDKGGKLLESRNATYKYDKEGNLIEKKEKNGKVWLYEWNAAGMLVKVIRPDKDQVTFGYDALGRRVWKRIHNTITKWIWDGNKPLHDWKEHALSGDILSDTTVGADGVITWLFDEDSFVRVAKLKGEKKYSIITDHLGTPVQMYQEDGTRFWQGELDSYGRMRMEQGDVGSCPFRYQGQYADKETGLYYNRFRYYAPEEGMYVSQDPIRLEGGSQLYEYVHDPTSTLKSLNCRIKFSEFDPGFSIGEVPIDFGLFPIALILPSC